MHVKELFPYLRVHDAKSAIRFYVEAFGATEKFRLTEPTGRIGHAELTLGDFIIMLSDEYPEMNILGPKGVGRTTFSIHLHVDDADKAIERAVKAGATLIRPVRDEFYGERGGVVEDPFGHHWNIGHQIEEVTPAEMQRRYDAMF